MKNFEKMLLAVLSVLLFSGCASLPPIEMTRQDYVKSPCYIAPLSFEKFKRPENWESEKEWNNHVQAWQAKFNSWVMGQVWRKVQYLDKDMKSGLIVKPYVINIEKHYIPVLGGDDVMAIYVDLIDAASNEKIGTMQYTSYSDGAGYEGFSFGGRIGQCANHAGQTLGAAMAELLDK